MYWLYGALLSSMLVIFLLETTKKASITRNGIIDRYFYSPILVFLYASPLIYVSACRHSFWDTSDYRLMYDAIGGSIGNVYNDTVPRVEKGYLLFTALLNKISDDSQFLLIVSSVFTIGVICYFLYKESSDLSLSFIVFSSQIWMATMNGLRQYMVAAALLLVWRWWSRSEQSRKNDIIFIIVVLLMSTFHSSVLICIPVFFCARGKLCNKKTLLCIGTAFVMLLVPSLYNAVFGVLLGGTDYGDLANTNAAMGVTRFVISCIPAVLIAIYCHSRKDNCNYKLDTVIWMMNIVLINLACNMLALKMVYFARISIYLNIFELIVVPYCINKCFNKPSRKIIKLFIVIFYIYFFYRQMIAYGNSVSNFRLFYEVNR